MEFFRGALFGGILGAVCWAALFAVLLCWS